MDVVLFVCACFCAIERVTSMFKVFDLYLRWLFWCITGHVIKVVLIHGNGTGALRTAIHKHLRGNRMVKSFRLGRYGEGESGVTVVELK